MAHPAAPVLSLRAGDVEELTRLVRASSVRSGLAQRARIVLLASEGMRNAEIAEEWSVDAVYEEQRLELRAELAVTDPSLAKWVTATSRPS